MFYFILYSRTCNT